MIQVAIILFLNLFWFFLILLYLKFSRKWARFLFSVIIYEIFDFKLFYFRYEIFLLHIALIIILIAFFYMVIQTRLGKLSIMGKFFFCLNFGIWIWIIYSALSIVSFLLNRWLIFIRFFFFQILFMIMLVDFDLLKNELISLQQFLLHHVKLLDHKEFFFILKIIPNGQIVIQKKIEIFLKYLS